MKRLRLVPCCGCGKNLRRRNPQAKSKCAKCQSVARKKWRAAHKASASVYMREWRKKNKERYVAKIVAWRRKHPDLVRKYHLKSDRKIKRLTRLTLEAVENLCGCGSVHSAENRAKTLRRLLPATAHEIREAWSCIWGTPDEDCAGARRLYRDLKQLGAVRDEGTFYLLPERIAA